MKHYQTKNGRKLVTIIPGDGIGPEVTEAVVKILEAAKAPIEWEYAEAGASVFKRGIASGVPAETLEAIRRSNVVLKGPLETPVGFGEKSANVTLRKLFELYANVRPARELPGVPTPFGGRHLDIVVVRENVEDLYAAIEHMQTPGVAQCLKLISHLGSEKIIRLAFELARAEGRSRVHCATKANIMKLTEGLFKRTFEQIAPEYDDILAEHIIIDNCAHQLVRYPEQFEVIVTTNMNGDIISDLTSGLAGGLGFAPSANIGNRTKMFEAVHGSAPTIAGKNLANPTALLLSSVMMLRHLDEFELAAMIEHALLVTLERGRYLTMDVVGEHDPATTDEFTAAIIGNLGVLSQRWNVREYRPIKLPELPPDAGFVEAKSRQVVGVDIFVESREDVSKLGRSLEEIASGTPLQLKMVSSRGTKVYPATEGQQTDCVDHWRCRFVAREQSHEPTDQDLLDFVGKVGQKHKWMHIEKLQRFDGEDAFTRAQGED